MLRYIQKTDSSKMKVDTIRNLTYDELGHIIRNDRGGSEADMTYSHDMLHGWVTGIQSAGGFEQTLYRERGMLDTKKYGLIDDLEISYNGNQRTAVTDNAGSLSYDNASDFVDGADETEEYSYDANGALSKDLNRGIDMIEYDLLGNPKKISFSDDKSIEYVYSADGVKLRETHISPILNLGSTSRATATVSKKTFYKKEVIDYMGNLILKNGHPQSLQFDGGYVSFDSDTIPGIHYYIQDYMGNNRMVVNGCTDSIEQVTHYYPYGGVIGDISTNDSFQRHKFEGKELDRTFGLDNYDIQARNYFAMAPMWDRIDPLAESFYSYSPYSYCLGDPINKVDKDGEFPSKTKAEIARSIHYTFCSMSETVSGVQENPNATDSNKSFYFDTYSYNNDDGIVITQEYNISNETSEKIGYIGTGCEIAGVGLACTVAGAEAGAVVAKIGSTLNNVATVGSIFTDVINGNMKSALTNLISLGIGLAIMGGINDLVPEEQDKLGNKILNDGASATQDLMQSTINYKARTEDEDH